MIPIIQKTYIPSTKLFTILIFPIINYLRGFTKSIKYFHPIADLYSIACFIILPTTTTLYSIIFSLKQINFTFFFITNYSYLPYTKYPINQLFYQLYIDLCKLLKRISYIHQIFPPNHPSLFHLLLHHITHHHLLKINTCFYINSF